MTSPPASPQASHPAPLGQLLQEARIVVCCGSGGVGKTTVAAALGVRAATLGRRVCVVTIDPARRLADALGLDREANDPVPVAGEWPGSLAGVVLDPKRTFDDLVRAHAPSGERAEQILANRIYRNLTSALSGTQEYMAMEKLHQLTTSGQFDLVVVDTPPTRNAIDFLDAPRRLTRFLSHRLFQLLLMPTRAYLRAVSLASQALLRTIAKVAGAEVVDDAVAFFQAFEGMEEGFRRRAEETAQALADPSTAFVLVSAPRAEAVAEARWFAERLAELRYRVAALVVNRMVPAFPCPDPGPAPADSALADLVANWRRLAEQRARQEAVAEALARHVGTAVLLQLPLLPDDVHDLAGLAQVAGALEPDPGAR
ncbi:ArsA family ATPase [Aciditerrimonas ferrireducens]|uniref:ArsA family ATPase n=1 Tax=Aciditerrimonas ferrireducens TaxID=667306 RepID=UPI0020056B3F|nr:ArsA-related P-loop ATPase [Aciditerrimonas ferrireducens]MCK4176800.1 AAA family ATPase [Aciditerrimonas ferrireducens]